jgi:hypothetical protein
MKTNPTGTYLMRPPHQRSTEFLSRRYDLTPYDYENITWDFYESLHKSAPTALAREEGENSIESFRLDKYVKLSQVPPQKPQKVQYPPPFNKLIPLQSKTGKWMDPNQVRKVLDIPDHLTLSNTVPWEEATAFALAAMRIRCDLFDLLHDHHDKAFGLITDKSLLYRAAHIVGAKEFDLRDQIVHDRGNSDRQREIEEQMDREAIIPKFTDPNKNMGHNHDSAGGVRESQLSREDSMLYCESVSNATSITKYTYEEAEPYDFSKPKGRNSTLSNSSYVPLTPLAPLALAPKPQTEPVRTPAPAEEGSRPGSRGSSKRKPSSRARTPTAQTPKRSPSLSRVSSAQDIEPPNELAVSVAAAVAEITQSAALEVDVSSSAADTPALPNHSTASSPSRSPGKSPSKLAAMMAKTQHAKDLPRIAALTREIDNHKVGSCSTTKSLHALAFIHFCSWIFDGLTPYR